MTGTSRPCDPCDLDPRQCDLVELPNKFEKISADVLRARFWSVSALASGQTAPEDASEIQPAWPFEGNESVGSRQSQVERGSRVTAVADPSIGKVSVGHTGSKIVPIGLLPARTPKENIKVYDRQSKPLPEEAGYGRLTAARAADDNDAPRM